ncbi:MAG: hypothetical protein IIZ43_03380 [Eubacterium sp.]|nr:hypothetical protein [Eubacterium sp.]
MDQAAYNEQQFYQRLSELGITDYIVREHEALFSANQEGAEEFMFPGLNMKNLLIKDKKTEEYFLLMLEDHRRMDQKHFKALTGWHKNRFATAEELWDLMKITPGSVTPYCLFNDTEKRITAVVGNEVVIAPEDEWINFHPCRNTATISLRKRDFLRVLRSYGNQVILEESPD